MVDVLRGLQFVWHAPLAQPDHRVCLTFDDGPNGIATEKVLSVLEKWQAPATFFLIGQNVERNPALARAIVSAGHQVGNHSYNHALVAFASEPRMRDNLERANRVIEQATGQRPRYFRPPYGVLTSRLRTVCEQMHLRPVGVHVYASDSMRISATGTASRVLRSLRGRSGIIVLHDGAGTFPGAWRAFIASALAIILSELQQQHYGWASPDEFPF
jgi:peptidoglycan/xylan/chitin deacetylase (PgdA/CDA1 family)